MKYFIYISLILLSLPLFSNEVEIIKLHENKSLDQLVLDQIENENSLNLQITNTDNDEIKLDEEIDSQNLIESENINNEIDIKENIWNNIDPQYVKNVLNNTQNIRSKVLQKMDNRFDVFVGQVGYWLPWDPNADKVADEVFQNSQLNDMMEK